jgi:hypothetical protein
MPRTHPRIPPGMAKAILGYDAEATKILQDFINTVEAEKPPPLLYHYTNASPCGTERAHPPHPP